MPIRTLALLSDDSMIAHDPGPGHPERPDRLRAILQRFRAEAPSHAIWRPAPRIERADLARLHDPIYLDRLDAMRGRSESLDEDTAVCPASIDAADRSAGATLEAVRMTLAGECRSAFALVRPPGHHAERDRAMGFCLYANVAVAAAHVLDNNLARRVLILDWDVHHGNGTQHLLEDRADVLFISLHQSPLWPGSGAADEIGVGPGAGYTINIPLPLGRSDADYLAVFDQIIDPIADRFAPDLLIVSAGFDAHAADPLGGMNLTDRGFAAMTSRILDIADRNADGRAVLVLEGGYDLEALGASALACAEVLGGEPAPPVEGAPDAATGAAIEAVMAAHADHWRFEAVS